MEVTKSIKDLIYQKSDANKIAAIAKENGMITIVMDGLIKAMKGTTALEEIIRVTKE